MSRKTRAQADELERRVREAREAMPRATQEELGAALGVSRDLVGYYLNRTDRGLNRRAAVPKKRGPKPRKRHPIHRLAMRQVAVQAVHAAFPYMTTGEIAAALPGMTRHQVKHYLRADVKAATSVRPSWADTLIEACDLAGRGHLRAAANAFYRLQPMLVS